MANDPSHLKKRISQGVSVIEFADRKILEELLISEIGDELIQMVTGTPSIKLLLSFKNVEHLSSAALGMLIRLNDKVGEQSGKLKLSDITPQIFDVFKITGLNRFFQIHDTTTQALESF